MDESKGNFRTSIPFHPKEGAAMHKLLNSQPHLKELFEGLAGISFENLLKMMHEDEDFKEAFHALEVDASLFIRLGIWLQREKPEMCKEYLEEGENFDSYMIDVN